MMQLMFTIFIQIYNLRIWEFKYIHYIMLASFCLYIDFYSHLFKYHFRWIILCIRKLRHPISKVQTELALSFVVQNIYLVYRLNSISTLQIIFIVKLHPFEYTHKNDTCAFAIDTSRIAFTPQNRQMVSSTYS